MDRKEGRKEGKMDRKEGKKEGTEQGYLSIKRIIPIPIYISI